MRIAELVSEAWRNILSGTTRLPLFAFLILGAIAVPAILDTATILGIEQQARQYITSGAATKYIAVEKGVDSSSCDALHSYTKVTAAGALRAAPDATIAGLPGATIQTYAVSSGFTRILGISSSREGIWLSKSFARSLGVTPGSTLTVNGTPTPIAGMFDYPEDGRDTRLTQAIVIPTLDDDAPFDECWMSTWPIPKDPDALLRTALSADGALNSDVTIAQLNRSLGSELNAHALFTARLTQWAPAAAGIAAIAIGFASIRLRRLEYAAALHAGLSRLAMIAGVLVETSAWVAVGAATAVATAATVITILDPRSFPDLLSFIWVSGLAAAGGALLGALAAASSVRESALFRYFKER